MKKLVVWALAFAFVFSVAAMAGDNTATAGNVPKLIRISKYEVKPGKVLEFSGLVRQVRQALNEGNADYHWIAATPATGNTGAVELIGFYDSFAEIDRAGEAARKNLGSLMQSASFNSEAADAIQANKAIIGRYREDLSYNPQKLDIANATTWDVGIVHLKPGTQMDFADLEKEAIELHKRGNIDEHWVTYEVEYGSGPAFIYITSLRSLADLDVDRKEAHKAVFTDSIRRRFAEVARKSVESETSTLLTVKPDLSRPSQTLVAANPTFWTVKEPEAPTVAKKRAKKEAVEPAVLKEKEKK